MRKDWDQRARENARYYVANGREQWTDEEYFRSGESNVEQQILNDISNVCQGKDPRQMRVLEIGCGTGRMTRTLAKVFGEVYAVDISGEMVRQARIALRDFPNAHVFQNSGNDLSAVREALGGAPLDFAFSFIVFQHIPSREVIENYVREVHALLRPGALFKFQVQGEPGDGDVMNSWFGVPYTEKQARDLAERNGFEMRYQDGVDGQYYWLWFFKSGGEEYFRSGEADVEREILSDRQNVCQGKDPKQMRVLEIGCGMGRITRALAQVFGEVYAIDSSPEAARQARAALRDFPNAHVLQDNGRDLSVVREAAAGVPIDFAFSYEAFQSIPSREAIENYVRETVSLLRDGALFKFQVRGEREESGPRGQRGAEFPEVEARRMAERCGFEMRYHHFGADRQHYWLWFFKNGERGTAR